MVITMINKEGMTAFRSGRISGVARTLERARECAGALARGAAPGAPAEEVSFELAHRLLPHLESDARLATAIPGDRGASLHTELTGERRELGRLVEVLDGVLVDAVRRSPRRLARTLEAVVALLERHLLTERELWAALDGAGTSEELLTEMSREAEATERLAERSLRFVWHPPVAPTAAKALWWTSPGTRRVVVLDGTGASGLRDGARGRDRTEAG